MKPFVFFMSILAASVFAPAAFAQNDAGKKCLDSRILNNRSSAQYGAHLSGKIASCDRALAAVRDSEQKFKLLRQRGDLHLIKAKNPRFTPEAKGDRAALARHANAAADDFVAAFQLHVGELGKRATGMYGYLPALPDIYEALELTRRYDVLADIWSTRLRLLRENKDYDALSSKMYRTNVAEILLPRAGANLLARRFDAAIADVDRLLPEYKDVGYGKVSLSEAWLLNVKGEALMYKQDRAAAAKLFDQVLKKTKPFTARSNRYFDEVTRTYKTRDPLDSWKREPRARAYFNRAVIRHSRGEGEAALKDYEASITLASRYGPGREGKIARFDTQNDGVGRHIYERYAGMARFMAQKGIPEADRALRAPDARTRYRLFLGALTKCVGTPNCTPGR